MSAIPLARVAGVRFHIAGSEEHLQKALVQITQRRMNTDTDQPQDGGIEDLRMGTTDSAFMCKTCYKGKPDCLGHAGVIALKYPVINPISVEHLVRWLKIVCHNCSRLLVPAEHYKRYPVGDRFNAIIAAASRTAARTCSHCKTPQMTIMRASATEHPLEITARSGDATTKRMLHPHIIEGIVSRITDDDVFAVCGSVESHPRNFVLRAVPIPPVTTRPAMRKTNGSKATNDEITTIIQMIVNTNLALPDIIPEQITEDLQKLVSNLGMYYYTMIRGNAASGAAMSQSVSLKGKRGLIREHLLGKRVFIVARSTIVGDHSIPPNALGVPLYFATVVEIEEIVQTHNRARILEYIRNAKTQTYPSATAIIKASTGARYAIEYADTNDIENGDRVMRNLIDGDLCLFNRQPTLTISNISAHRVIVLRDPNSYSIRLNVIATPLYNADFDGDAMHIIFCATEAARVELRYLSTVNNWFTLYTTSGPLMGQVDDGVVGMAELTRDDTVVDRYHAMQIFAHTRRLPSFTKDTYTGREIVSLLLTQTPINLTKAPTFYDRAKTQYIDYSPTETTVKIVNGELVSGVLDKSTIGKGAKGGVYHVIANEYNAEVALGVMHDMQAMVIAFLEQRGYTIGILDIMPSAATREKIHLATSDALARARVLADEYTSGNIVASFGETKESMYEKRLVAEALRSGDDYIDAIMNDINPRWNGLYRMIATGSKGNQDQLLNMMAGVGQKLLNGARTATKFGFARTDVYSQRFPIDPIDGGYIANSLVGGMNSHEFLANTAASRFDLTLKALSTSVTGEQSRKSIKCLESLICDNMRRVTKTGQIIEIVAGDNYADARYLEDCTIPTVAMGDNEIKGAYPDPEWHNIIIRDRDIYRKQFMALENLRSDTTMIPTVRCLFNIDRIIANALAARPVRKPLTQPEMKAAVTYAKTCIDEFAYVYMHPCQKARKATVMPHHIAAAWLPQMILRTRVNPKTIGDLRLDIDILRVIFGNVQLVVLHGMVTPGTPIGIIAAQAFSEPFTQYMLDAHHRSATGGSSFDSVNAVKALLGAKSVDTLTNPMMFLRVKSQYEADRVAVTNIANMIEMISLRNVIDRYQVFFEAYGRPKHPSYIAEAADIEQFGRLNPLLVPPSDLINYAIRFVVNKHTLLIKGLPIEYLVTRLRVLYPGLYFMHTPENAPVCYIRAYIRSGAVSETSPGAVTTLLKTMLETMVRGVDGITATMVEPITRSYVGDGGALSTRQIYAIKTRGTNFLGVMAIPQIDPTMILTDSVQEIASFIGIVAARQQIVNIMKDLLPSKELINWSHFMLYADEMTSTGKVTAIEQQGVDARDAENIYLRMGFTAPLTKIIEAGVNALTTEISGITPSLMVGAVPQIGTNYDTYVADTEFIRKNVKSTDAIISDVFG